MKPIEIDKINLYKKFITRKQIVAKLLAYEKEAGENQCLIFLVQGNIIVCDQNGKCRSVNGKGPEWLDTNYGSFDVFYDEIESGWVNLNKSVDKDGKIVYSVDQVVHESIEQAKKAIMSSTYFSTVKIEWSVE